MSEDTDPGGQTDTSWESQVGWIYAGHGEWVPADNGLEVSSHGNDLEREPRWVQQWLNNNDTDIGLCNKVRDLGYPNRWGAKHRVTSKWNLDKFEQLLKDYEDKEIVKWLKYVWPIGRLQYLEEPEHSSKNHKGATEFPQDLEKYIKKEQSYGAVKGPYRKIPFNGKVGISPLSTRPKKDSTERRVILDLSFPIGGAVNDGIPKDTYMGFAVKLTFPKTDDFAVRIFQLGEGCCMFKVDLSRYFRQIPLDPGDYALIGYVINGDIYFDKVLPMGMRSAPYIAQRITDAIAYIHRQMSMFLLNYMDDFVGAEERLKAWQAYNRLIQLLETIRVETSKEKLVPPNTRLEFLGITFDSETMAMEISSDKIKEIQQEVGRWLTKTAAKQKMVESLIGKLQFVAKCVRSGRIFLSRLIQCIRGMDRRYLYTIPQEARKDIVWWGRFIQAYNGV